VFRNNKFKITEHLNVNFNSGGLGDCVAQMVAVKYMRDRCPNVVQHCWVPDYFVDFAKKLCPGVLIKSHSEAAKKYNPKIGGVQMVSPGMQHTSMGTHLVDLGFHLLVDKQVPIEQKNYLPLPPGTNIDRFKLPEKYVVLTVGFTAPNREMLPSVANGIIDYCTSKNIPVVTLGSTANKIIPGTFKEEIKLDQTINLVNNTNILEAGAIISKSACIVGLDNGLLHVAGCTEVPIIVGFTNVLPEHRLPIRHNELGWNCYVVEPEQSLECRGCQSRMAHVYGHDFRGCYYGDMACLSQLTADKYIAHMEKLL
jgi:ADP-heptose:LPS heptosyltransferase